MIEDKIIKENYLRMSDAALLYFAKTEGSSLTPSALVILYQEFKTRSLNTDIFISNAENNLSIEPSQPGMDNHSDHTDFIKAIWIYIFQEKENGKSNKEILNGLIQKGVNEAHAAALISTIENKTVEILATLNKNVLRGAIISLLGAGISIWTYSSFTLSTIYILSWGAIVVGIFLLFKGVSSKSRYKTILSNIETERILFAETVTDFEVIEPIATAPNENIKPVTPPPGTG